MLGIVFFLVSLTAGYSLISWCVPRWSLSVRLALGSVAGITLTAWIGLALSLLFGLTAGLALTAGICLLASIAGYRFWPVTFSRRIPFWAALGTLFILVPALYLYVTHALTIQAGGWDVPGYTWGDLPFHMGIISAVAYQPRVPVTFPVFYQAPLSYPFLIDFYSGALLRYSAGWQLSVLLPGITLFLAGCYLSFWVVRSLLSPKGAYLHLLLFLLAGSPAGIGLFLQTYRANGWSAAILTDYTNISAQGLDFANPITSHFLPQRSFLIGFAIAMAVFALLIEYIQRKGKSIWLAAVLTGLLPLAHTHSFFVVAALWVVLSIFLYIRRTNHDPTWWYALLVMVVLAFPQLYWQFHTTYHSGFGSWYFGWMRAPSESIWHFWWRNVGLFLPLLAVTPWAVRRIKDPVYTSLYVVGLGIAIAINIRIFQPSAWDNMKLILYSYWILLVPIVWILRYIWQHKMPFLTVLIVMSMTVTGLLAVIREMEPQQTYQLYSSNDLAAAADLRVLLPLDANVLILPEHNNIVPTLTGRHVLSGYSGWLWTYGINYQPEETARTLILQGAPTAQALIAYYGLTDFVISDAEVAKYGISLSYLASLYPEIYAKHGWYVFSLVCGSHASGACDAQSAF